MSAEGVGAVSATRTPATSARLARLPRSGVREIMDIALGLPDAIRLEIGDPDFTTPSHIIDAAAEAARAGFTHYTSSSGLPSLRALIADRSASEYGIACSADDVVVTTGACGGIHAALLAVLDPGDELLVPDPGWTTYVPMALAAGVVPVGYRLDPANGFAIDPAEIERRVTPRTRAIVVNSPGNPTGAVAARDVLIATMEVAARHGLWVISDECYADLVFEGEHVSPASFADPERVLSAFSFSKTYAMTGWRIGYIIAGGGLAPMIAKAQEPVVSSASTISQKAAEAAISGPQDCVDGFRDAYRRRRDLALVQLDAAGVPYVRPGGTFYLMVDVSAAPDGRDGFARRLLLEHGVAVVPGSAFGDGGAGMVRVSLAAADEKVVEGLTRLCAALGVDSTPLA
jgi:aspartate aminotransferase